MSEPKWTPGPWEARGCELVGESTLIATLHWHSGRAPANEADAALIAAAPDLYEALDRALDLMTGMQGAFGDPKCHEEREIAQRIAQTRAALARARGEA